MNNLLSKGTDVLNTIRAVHSVWLKNREMNLKLFFGDRWHCKAIYASDSETDTESFLTKECRGLEEDRYADDILSSKKDLKELDIITERVEGILRDEPFMPTVDLCYRQKELCLFC